MSHADYCRCATCRGVAVKPMAVHADHTAIYVAETDETLRKLRVELSQIRDHFETELSRGVAQACAERDAEIARLRAVIESGARQEHAREDELKRLHAEEEKRLYAAYERHLRAAREDVDAWQRAYEAQGTELIRLRALHEPALCYRSMSRADLEVHCDALAIGKARAEEERDAAREALREACQLADHLDDVVDRLGQYEDVSHGMFLAAQREATPKAPLSLTSELRKRGGIDG